MLNKKACPALKNSQKTANQTQDTLTGRVKSAIYPQPKLSVIHNVNIIKNFKNNNKPKNNQHLTISNTLDF
jgi:hypothetical protein